MDNKIQYISNGITKEITKDELIIMLNNRINKAIEYIKRYDGKPVLRDYYDRDLLNILQGSDKE